MQALGNWRTKVAAALAAAMFLLGLLAFLLPTSAYIDLPPSGQVFIDCGVPAFPTVRPDEGRAFRTCTDINDAHQRVAATAMGLSALMFSLLFWRSAKPRSA